MNSEETSNADAYPDSVDTDAGLSSMDYDTEGLAIKEEGAKESLIFPGPDSDYPLREASEDPGWAVKIAAIWVGIASFFIVFILVFMILGVWYD